MATKKNLRMLSSSRKCCRAFCDEMCAGRVMKLSTEISWFRVVLLLVFVLTAIYVLVIPKAY